MAVPTTVTTELSRTGVPNGKLAFAVLLLGLPSSWNDDGPTGNGGAPSALSDANVGKDDISMKSMLPLNVRVPKSVTDPYARPNPATATCPCIVRRCSAKITVDESCNMKYHSLGSSSTLHFILIEGVHTGKLTEPSVDLTLTYWLPVLAES